jgi:cytochrome b5
VLLDVAGQDVTESFEDVGHSDEAREILKGLAVGNLKRVPEAPAGLQPRQKLPAGWEA